MKLLLDLLPVVVFFLTYRCAKWAPQAAAGLVGSWLGAADAAQQTELSAVMLATAAAIAATAVQVGYLLARRHPVRPSVWISAGLIVVFGGLTVWLRNEWFIKWKPTILYWTFALVLLAGRWIWRRNLLGSLLSQEVELPPRAWDRLLHAWSAFFLAIGGVNLLVAYSWSTDSWVNFKTFGSLGLTFVFSLVSGWLVLRDLPPPTGGAKADNDARG